MFLISFLQFLRTDLRSFVVPESVVIFAEKDEFDKLKPSSPKTAKR